MSEEGPMPASKWAEEFKKYCLKSNPALTARGEKPKHTPEPWRCGSEYTHTLGMRCVLIESGPIGDDAVCIASAWASEDDNGAARADGNRIIACVNACAGMADPASTIDAMREDNQIMRESLVYLARSSCKVNPPCSSRIDYACDSCTARNALQRAKEQA